MFLHVAWVAVYIERDELGFHSCPWTPVTSWELTVCVIGSDLWPLTHDRRDPWPSTVNLSWTRRLATVSLQKFGLISHACKGKWMHRYNDDKWVKPWPLVDVTQPSLVTHLTHAWPVVTLSALGRPYQSPWRFLIFLSFLLLFAGCLYFPNLESNCINTRRVFILFGLDMCIQRHIINFFCYCTWLHFKNYFSTFFLNLRASPVAMMTVMLLLSLLLLLLLLLMMMMMMMMISCVLCVRV